MDFQSEWSLLLFLPLFSFHLKYNLVVKAPLSGCIPSALWAAAPGGRWVHPGAAELPGDAVPGAGGPAKGCVPSNAPLEQPYTFSTTIRGLREW